MAHFGIIDLSIDLKGNKKERLNLNGKCIFKVLFKIESISSVELCCFTRYRVWKTKLLGVQEIEKWSGHRDIIHGNQQIVDVALKKIVFLRTFL